MNDKLVERRLAAIMFTDLVGYSALSQRNEALALELLAEHQAEMRRLFPRFGGREVKTLGDGFLLEFPSALDAVRAAVEMQRVFHDENLLRPADKRFLVRIGIHLGDVVVQGDDIYGDGVNIASRIEKFAPAGGICISSAVHEQVYNKLEQPLAAIGPAELKNIRIAMVLHRVVLPWEPVASPPEASGPGESATRPPRREEAGAPAAAFDAVIGRRVAALGWRRIAGLGIALGGIVILAVVLAYREAPVAPAAPRVEKRQPTPADRINHLMARSKWLMLQRETVVSETPNKKAATGALRGVMRELRGIAFDDPLLPEDFREAYLRWVGSNEKALDLAEQFPDLRDSWQLVGFALRIGWDAMSNSSGPGLKDQVAQWNETMRADLTALDQVAARHGARTDWEALPRVEEVIAGGPAEMAGVRVGDFFWSIDGAALFRKVPAADEAARAGIFLSPDGPIEVDADAGGTFGVVLDTLCNQPPVVVHLIPFAILDGFHVQVTNTSQDLRLENIVVTYHMPGVGTKEQTLGALAPLEGKSIDPSKIDWMVAPTQTLSIRADGHMPRDFEVSKMIE
jgi:class 3 adenylate cyclase